MHPRSPRRSRRRASGPSSQGRPYPILSVMLRLGRNDKPVSPLTGHSTRRSNLKQRAACRPSNANMGGSSHGERSLHADKESTQHGCKKHSTRSSEHQKTLKSETRRESAMTVIPRILPSSAGLLLHCWCQQAPEPLEQHLRKGCGDLMCTSVRRFRMLHCTKSTF